ncbi:hypothetical protein SO802_029466 [Lithocarpus litseifolius]|uniref:Uncharacterized protein n=1 Tax=Lithocarpus litseifolius TaxID=425828 RepID=A0AAW2BVE3_9ROSI
MEVRGERLAGPRICFGKEMAFLQMKRIVAGVLRRFKVVPAFQEGVNREPEFVSYLTSQMKEDGSDSVQVGGERDRRDLDDLDGEMVASEIGETWTARHGVVLALLFLDVSDGDGSCAGNLHRLTHFPFTCINSGSNTFNHHAGFSNKHATKPRLGLVNKDSLDKILKAEEFVNSDSLLRAAHLILGYNPISSSFQAPKCVIKAKDPLLRRISVAALSFLLLEGTPIPEGTLPTFPIFEGFPISNLASRSTPGEATPSQHSIKEEKEEKEKQKEIVEVSDSEDPFEAFNQPLSPEVSKSIPKDREESARCVEDMWIQRKPRSILQELLESQPGRDGPGKVAQSKPPAPPTIPPPRADPPKHKRKREDKGKDVMEAVQAAFHAEEIVGMAHRRAKDKEARRIFTVDAFRVAEKSIQELHTKLVEEEREKKSAAAALDSAKRQAEGQRVLLRKVEDQLASSKQQIITLQKKLEEAQKAKELAEKAKEEAETTKDEVEQQGYDIGVVETEDALRAEVLGVCRDYCSQVWIEALNQAKVEASSILRKAENIYYPPAVQETSSSGQPAESQPKVADPAQGSSDVALLSSNDPPGVAE